MVGRVLGFIDAVRFGSSEGIEKIRAGIRFAFVEYMKVAYPVMLITIVLSMIYLELRYL